MTTYPVLTIQDLDNARAAFGTHEPRDIFYRAASDLVQLVRSGGGTITLGEALAVLLQTWNKQYYQFRPATAQHFQDVDDLITKHSVWLTSVQARLISSVTIQDLVDIGNVFDDFAQVLGPVGASKALHLLAPRFLPLWDQTIAESYGLKASNKVTNADRYRQWVGIVKGQAAAITLPPGDNRNVLKAIDEYNYCHFTKGWI
jgi:hypothetical protein